MNYHVLPLYQVVIAKASTKKTVTQRDRIQVFQLLTDSLLNGKIKEANLSGAEICASGWHQPLWEVLIAFYFRHINYVHPTLLDYLNQQYLLYNELKKVYTGNVKNLCNNQELRNHLSETVSILSLSPKETLNIPTQARDHPIDGVILDKTSKFVGVFVKGLPIHSTPYQYFFHFVTNYYNNTMDNCLFYLNWFVTDTEYVLDTELDFKIPPILNKKSVLLIWKFLVLQIKTQIKFSKDETQTDHLTETIETVLSFYLLFYKKHDLETCTYIVIYLLVMARSLEHFNQAPLVKVCDPQIIRQCAEINFLYQQLSHTPVPKTKGGKSKKLSKKLSETTQFYEDPKNQAYLSLINNSALLREKPPSPEPVPVTSTAVTHEVITTDITRGSKEAKGSKGSGTSNTMKINIELI